MDRVCKLCGLKFKTGVVSFKGEKIRIGTRRLFCLKCVPFKSKNPNQYTGKPTSKIICKKCGNKFNAWINNKYKRKHCFKCVPLGSNANKCLGNSGSKLICNRCGKVYLYDRSKSHGSTKFCGTCRKRLRGQKLKIEAVKYKGGKCIICKFDSYVEALTFHHLDPDKKDFGISKILRESVSWLRLEKELDKCVLLCANCHAGVHAGHIEVG